MNLYADFRKCFQWGDEILQRGYIPDFLGQTIINIRRPMIYRHSTKFLAIIVVAEYNGALLKTRGKSGSRQPDRLSFPLPSPWCKIPSQNNRTHSKSRDSNS